MDIRQLQQQAYAQGYAQGQLSFDEALRQHVAALRAEFDSKLNQQAGGLRKMAGERAAQTDRKLSELATIASALSVSKNGASGFGGSPQRDEGNIIRPGMVRIEDIPGKRVPYTLIIEIPISRADMSPREESFTISQSGPFVAVRRMAAFLSSHQFETTDPDTLDVAQFASRSYGRFRPVSSAWDLMDSQHNAQGDASSWWWSMLNNAGLVAGSRMPTAALGLASSMSSFRTMEFDGRIEVRMESSDMPRQNLPVPSAFWSKSINSPWDLACLDFVERGDTVRVKVTPSHMNNPAAGNVNGAVVFPQTGNGLTGWPFLDGQFDAHEGIATPGGAEFAQNDPELPNLLVNDSVTRLPDGILIVGFEGYRILQPIGVAP